MRCIFFFLVHGYDVNYNQYCNECIVNLTFCWKIVTGLLLYCTMIMRMSYVLYTYVRVLEVWAERLQNPLLAEFRTGYDRV